MRPLSHSLLRRNGLPIRALLCALTVAVAGVLSAQAGSPLSTRTHRATQAVGGEWRIVSGAPLAGQRINALLVDRTDRVWAGTEEQGLALWDGESWQALTTRDGLPDDRVVALFEDRQGRVWVVTGRGLGYVPPHAVTFRRLGVAGLTALPVLALAQGADGAMYLGTVAGLDRWQEDGALEAVAMFAGQQVTALHTSRDGTLWAGTEHGLWRLCAAQWEAETSEASIGAARIRGFAESVDGTLYVRTEADGLWRTRGDGWQRVALPAGVSTGISAVGLIDGRIWLGTNQGVWANEAPVWQQFGAGLLPGGAVTAIAPASDGRLWIGTAGGLVEYRPDRTVPVVEIVAINGMQPRDGAVMLAGDRVERVEVRSHDGGTATDRLAIFTRLDGVDNAPQLHRGETITAYSGRRLVAGDAVLHVWAQDEAFNRSEAAEVTVVTPKLMYGPGGVTVRSDVAYPALGAAALVLLAGATARATITGQRRIATRQAAEAAARVQAVVARGFNPYERGAVDALLPQQPVQDVMQALRVGNVLLIGARGMGKTLTLGRVAALLRTEQHGETVSIPAYLDVSGTRPDDMHHTLMNRVAAGMEPLMVGERPRLRWHDTATADYGADEFNTDLHLLLTWLRPLIAPRQVRVVLLLDEIQALDDYPPRVKDQVRRLLVGTMEGHLRVVLAGEHAPRFLGELGDLFHQVDLKPLSESAARELLVGPVTGIYEWEPAAVDLAIEDAAGRAERLLGAAAASVRRALAAGRLDITAADVAPLPAQPAAR